MAKTNEQKEQEALEKAQIKEAKRRANILAAAPITEKVEEPAIIEEVENGVKEIVEEQKPINMDEIIKNSGEHKLKEIQQEVKEQIMSEQDKDIEVKEDVENSDEIVENTNTKEKKKKVSLPKAKTPVPDEDKPVMKEFVYTLQELIDVANKYNKGELTIEDMNKFGQTMIVRNYLPLLDKMAIISAIMTGHLYSTTSIQEMRLAELYRNLFFYGLLEGYAMIDCKDRELITFDNYDLLYPVFGAFIKSYCKDDWDFFMEYVRDSINTYGIVNMMDVMSGIDTYGLQKTTEENKKLVKDLNKNAKLISDLREIAEITDPLNKKIKEELRKIGVAKAKMEAKLEIEKMKANNTKEDEGENITDIVKAAIEKDREELAEQRQEIKDSLGKDEEDDDFEF